MTNSQRHSVRLSEIRERINALNAIESLSDEQTAELRDLTGEYPSVETRYRAALVAEDEIESRGSQDAGDSETRGTLDLLRESRASNFMQAALQGRTVEGREADLLGALNIENAVGRFPLQLLDSRFDASVTEDRVDAAVDLGADAEQTQVGARPWLERVFVRGGEGEFLGVTRESVASGDRRYVAFTTANTASAVARGAEHDSGAVSITTQDVEPQRATVGFLFRSEDTARHPGLEAVLRRDMRMTLSTYMDRALLRGAGTEFTGIAETATPIITSTANLKAVAAANPNRAELLGLFTGALDGTYAAAEGDLSLVLNRATYNKIMVALALGSTATIPDTVLEVVRRMGFSIRVSEHMPAATTATSNIGVMSKARGRVGSLVMPMWESGTLIVDPYSGAKKGETRLTLSLLYGKPTVVRQDNWLRVLSVA